jgi:hypothetical protein
MGVGAQRVEWPLRDYSEAAIPPPHYYAGQRAAMEGFQLDGS